MATLSVNGIDETIITQLRVRAKNLNTDIDDLVRQFIQHGLKTVQVKKAPNIDSLFGIIPSTTDGIELQNEMREE
jgi:plasmid stability protein